MTGRPPTVVVGMHRSGTSLLVRLLDDLGLFIGRDPAAHSESRHFVTINRWMLEEIGATWDQPEAVEPLADHPEVVDALATHVRFLLSSPRSAGYMGWLRYLLTGGPGEMDRPWGWKDPRTTLLLPVWSEVFPEARLVHVRRHGVDVAASLRERHGSNLETWAGREASVDGWADLRQWLRPGWYPPRDAVVGSLRSLDLEEGLAMWASYLDQAQDHVEAHPGPVAELRYEDLLRDPEPHLRDLVDHAGLDPDPDALAAAVDRVDPGRAARYRDDEELRAVARDHADVLGERGFDAPDD